MASIYRNWVFNLILAVLASAAAAFATFAMPADLIEGLVQATGLSSLVSAAAPPLGTTARLVIMTVAAALAFVLVWLVLGAFDGPSARMSDAFAEDDDDWLAPRVRRADAHPDAPLRRPLLAAEDLGEPLQELYRNAEPSFEQAASPTEEPLELEIAQIADDQDWTEAETALEEPYDEEEPVEWDPAPLHLRSDDDDEGISTEELLARLPLPAQESASVSNLLQRLNTGLADSEWPLSAGKSDDAQAEMDDRLRSVLDDLQKMAGGNI